MKIETTVILAALGAVPMTALAQEPIAQTQEAFALNERTIGIVQDLMARDALYANAEGTQLRIRSSALNAETVEGLASSQQVQIDELSGDYIMNQDFAAALAGSRILHSKAPKTVADVILLMKLEKDLKSGMQVELASFHSAPFF